MTTLTNPEQELLTLTHIDDMLEFRIIYKEDQDKNGRSYFVSNVDEIDRIMAELKTLRERIA